MADSSVSLPTDFKKIITETAYPDPGLTPEAEQKFANRYSFGALVLQFVYYFAMDDALLAWLSIACSIIFIFAPLLLIFPFFARRRAYKKRPWSGFAEFYHNQKKWDREALYLLIATLVLGVVTFWIIGPMILNSFGSLNGGQTPSGGFTQQLQDTVQQYQNILGQ